MINISFDKGKIEILGHANYDEPGKDIVCGAVSTLTQTFIASTEELTTDIIKYDIEPGKAYIEYKDLSKESRTLLRSFFIGLKLIADNYNKYVKINQALKL